MLVELSLKVRYRASNVQKLFHLMLIKPSGRGSLVVQMVKESACNARDLGSIPGLGRSPGEGNGNPL